MRRFGLGFLVVCSLFVPQGAAHAAGRSLALHNLAGLLSSRAVTGAIQHAELRPMVAPDAIASAPAGQSATALYVAGGAFSPATLNSQFVGVEDNASADRDWFRSNHSQPYESMGRVTGYYERADWQPPGYSTTDDVYFRYMGSSFNSAASAGSALTDGVNYTQSQWGVTSTNCSGGGFQCADMAAAFTDGTVEEYAVSQYNQCLVEVSAQTTKTAASALTSQIETTLNSVNNAAKAAVVAACGTNQAPPPTPTPTTTSTPIDFTIIAVRVEPMSLKGHPDFNLVHPPLKTVKVGTQVLLSVYYRINSAPTNYGYAETVSVSRNGQTVINQNYPDTTDATSPVDTWRNAWTYAPGSAGNYTVTITVTMNGRSQSLSSSFKATKKAPPKAKKVSFSFDRITLLDSGGHPAKTFRRSQQFFVQLQYSVHHLKRPTSGNIIVTFVAPGSGKALFPPNSYQVTAANGRQSFRTHFFVPIHSPSSLTIVAGVSIGSGTRQRSATMSISG